MSCSRGYHVGKTPTKLIVKHKFHFSRLIFALFEFRNRGAARARSNGGGGSEREGLLKSTATMKNMRSSKLLISFVGHFRAITISMKNAFIEPIFCRHKLTHRNAATNGKRLWLRLNRVNNILLIWLLLFHVYNSTAN